MKFALFQTLAVAAAAAAGALAQNQTYLTVTALATNDQNNTVIQCWEFTTPLEIAQTPGIVGSPRFRFNSTTTPEIAYIGPRANGGLHNAPVPQFVYFTSGLAHVTLPHSDDEAWILGGENGLLIAVDTTGTGHYTTYPSDATTVALTVPILDGETPPYKVLSEGACHGQTQLVTE